MYHVIYKVMANSQMTGNEGNGKAQGKRTRRDGEDM